MNVNELMEQKAVTKYRLSQSSGVPYTTVCDICNGKTKLENCSAKTVYKIAKALGVSMESLLDFTFEERGSFDLYKSSVCHRVKEMGDIDFIVDTLEEEKNSKDMLVQFGEKYPGVTTQSNVNEILASLKTKKPSITDSKGV